MTKKSYLKGGDLAYGSMDDVFYVAEDWFKEGGERVGKVLGMTPKQIKRKNLLAKNTGVLASQFNFTHSPLQRTIRKLNEFGGTAYLDVKDRILKKRMSRYPQV